MVRFKNTVEKVLLTNFVIIELLKENSSGYKLEKTKLDKTVDYDFDFEQVCTPRQEYQLMQLSDNDSSEVRIFK